MSPTGGEPPERRLPAGAAPVTHRRRRRYRAKHYAEKVWPFYGLIAGVPLFVVLMVVGFSALPPYTPSEAEATAPAPASHATARPSAGNPTLAYEAETATRGGATKQRRVQGASGGLVVASVGNGSPAGDVTFTAVNAPSSGPYTLTVYYASPDSQPRTLSVMVNGQTQATLQFPPVGTAGGIGASHTTVQLAAGINWLRLGDPVQQYGPDLDRITLQPGG
jgi:hypothetical protein